MIIAKLKSHQEKALAYLKKHDPCALFMRVGYGKSLIALAYAEHVGAKRILITSDKSNVINTWSEEIWKHTSYRVVTRPRSTDWDDFPGPDPVCVCVNYEMLSRVWKQYKYIQWDMWIGDESSRFKNQRTDVFKHLSFVVQNIPHKVILNGKAVSEKLEDLFGQVRVLGEHAGRTFTQFRARYMMPCHVGYGYMPQRSALTRLQRDVKDITYWLDEDPDVHMPEIKRYMVPVKMPEQVRLLDEKLHRDFAATIGEDRVELEHAAAVFMKRYQLTSGIFRPTDHWTKTAGGPEYWAKTEGYKLVDCEKAGAAYEIVANNPDAKIVVWHHFIPDTEVLRRQLEDRCSCLYEYTDSGNSKGLEAFQKADRGVLLVRDSLCRGINQLAEADVVIYYSRAFSYQVRAQSGGRTQRVTIARGRQSGLGIASGTDRFDHSGCRGRA